MAGLGPGMLAPTPHSHPVSIRTWGLEETQFRCLCDLGQVGSPPSSPSFLTLLPTVGLRQAVPDPLTSGAA